MVNPSRVRVQSFPAQPPSSNDAAYNATYAAFNSSTATSAMSEQRHALRIIHYNNVYNIDEGDCEPIGGAARFVTAINQIKSQSPVDILVLFSGDAFSPAPLTATTMGAEMPPILNATNIDVACIGTLSKHFNPYPQTTHQSTTVYDTIC